MGQVQRRWAKFQRALITRLLGGRCAHCGEDDPKLLTFDCIQPKGDEHHKWKADKRITFYRIQMALDNLQLLCESCQTRKSEFEKRDIINEEDEPF